MSLGALIEVALCLYNLSMVPRSLHPIHLHGGICQCNHQTHHQQKWCKLRSTQYWNKYCITKQYHNGETIDRAYNHNFRICWSWNFRRCSIYMLRLYGYINVSRGLFLCMCCLMFNS